MNSLLFALVCVVSQDAAAGELPEEIAKWEGQVADLEAKDATDPAGSDAILFYGSSSIRRWKTIAEDMAPWPVLKRGYGGARFSDAGHYIDRVVGPRLGPDNPRRPRALVLFLANDIAGNRKLDVSPEEVAVRFRRIHDYVRGRDATIPIFWIEVTANSARLEVWPQVREAAALIRERLATDPGAHFIATSGAFIGPDNRPRDEWFVDDGLHLNDAGYDVWAALIRAKLQEVLGPAVPEDVAEWADDIAAFEASEESVPERPVLFYGSSSLRLWETMAEDMAPLPVLNRGYGGASLKDAAFYAERVIADHDPRAVVLFVGGDIYLRGRSPETAVLDFRRLLANIRKAKRNVPVVWVNVRPVLTWADKWPQVQELNRLVAEVAAEDERTFVLDVNGPLTDAAGGPREDLFAEDRVHLNAKGYKRWTAEMRSGLKRVLGPVVDVEAGPESSDPVEVEGDAGEE